MPLIKKWIVHLIFLLIAGSVASADECPVRGRTYSETQVLGDYYQIIAGNSAMNSRYNKVQYAIGAPPKVGSEQFCDEIDELKRLATVRQKYSRDIICETSIACFNIGRFIVGKEENKQKRPVTVKLIASSLYLLGPVLFSIKIKYDRVRPSYADPSLQPDITVPNHPSYPSGHATQAMLIAEILSLVHPDRQMHYIFDAERIARNREIAGLHYRSDSVAGFELAREFFSMLKAEKWFVELSKKAKDEWKAIPAMVP